jgi:hypothetical protein
MPDEMTNDEYRPTCPKCDQTGFRAILNRRITGVDKCPVMVICSEVQCQTVVGVLAYDDVYDI